MPGAFRREMVGTSVKQIASYNPARKLIMIVNDSEYTIYINKDPDGVKENGLPVYAFEIIVFDVADADAPEEMFFAVCESTNCPVRIYEALVT